MINSSHSKSSLVSEPLQSAVQGACKTLETIYGIAEICYETPPTKRGENLRHLISEYIKQSRVVAKLGYRPDNEKHRLILLNLEKELPRLPSILDAYDHAETAVERTQAEETRQLMLLYKEEPPSHTLLPEVTCPDADQPAATLEPESPLWLKILNGAGMLATAMQPQMKWLMERQSRRSKIHQPVESAMNYFKNIEASWFALSKLMDCAKDSLRLIGHQPEPNVARKRWTLPEANNTVMDYVKRCPKMPSSRRISEETGIPQPTVIRTKFWKEAMKMGKRPTKASHITRLGEGQALLADPTKTTSPVMAHGKRDHTQKF